MQIESIPCVVRDIVRQARRDSAIIGVVPTMGALHPGMSVWSNELTPNAIL